MLHRYFYQFLAVFLLCIVGHKSHGQTVLSPGDLVIIGANSTDLSAADPDNFSFAPLVDLAAGTQIVFTDNGWQTTGGFRATEGTAIYTAPAGGVPKGRIVTFSTGNHPDFTATGTFLLSTDGDQILAYQGTNASPRFIYGLTLRKLWSNATSSNTSAVPAGLQNGITAVAVPWCNGYLYQPAMRRGLTAAVRSNFSNASNWTGNNQSRVTWPITDLILEGLVLDATELQALQAFYTTTGGANWTNHSNWPGTSTWPATLSNVDFATWFGVGVSNGDVTSLTFNNSRLNGLIPEALSQLALLRELRLNQNSLSGYVPQSLAQLPLQVLTVANNKLISIPDFSRMPARRLAALTVDASNNFICFGPLEANFDPSTGQKLPFAYTWSNQSQPYGEDTETQNVGEPITLTCSFSGAHNLYQWGKGTRATWNAISGATAATYRINNSMAGDAGQYACKVTNSVVTGPELWTRTTTIVLRTGAAQAVTPPSAPDANLSRNWTIERTYDGEGNAISNILTESKQFTDALGRNTQAQARSRANPHVFASETMYDKAGQPVLQTLAAPINNQSFAYKEKFTAVTDRLGNKVEYGSANFEDTPTGAPDGLNVQDPGTLGYYYSTANDLEPLTPATAFPFSLSVPTKGPLGGLQRAGGPGEAFRVGSGHEVKGHEIPLLKEFDNYVALRHHFVAGNSLVTLQRQGTKTISIDADGRESVVVTNKEGQALVSCLTGTQYKPTIVFGFISTHPQPENESAPRFLDIHIPATGEHELKFTLNGQVRVRNLNGTGGVRLTGTGTYLDSADVVVNPGIQSPANSTTSTSVFLQPGFYRLVSLPSTIADEQTQWFTYDAEYGNFSYTYYDDAGRAVATVAPNGLAGNNLVNNSSFDLEVQASPGQYWNTAQYWQSDGATQAVFTEDYGGGHTGRLHETHYNQSGAPYHVTTHQSLSAVPNGTYTLRAWVKGSGRQNLARMFARNYGGADKSAAIGITPGGPTGAWSLLQINGIQVSNGQCDVGFESDATGSGQFIYFDDVVLARTADANQPQFATRNTYDTSSRLLATESTDEGRSEYVYARDGRIRFSQSALQRSAGRFSYSNYDEQGRVVESGEYAPTQDVVFQSQLPLRTIFEAEDALYISSDVSNFYAGAHEPQKKYVQNLNVSPAIGAVYGSAVQFSVTGVSSAGTYPVNLRYSAGFSSTRTMSVWANGAKVQQVFFPATGGWDVWDVVTVALPLQAGTNNIRVQYEATDNGAINLDYLEVLAEQTANSTSVLNLLEERVPTNSLLAANCRQRSFVTYDQVFTTAGANPEPLLTGRTQEFTNGAVTKTSNDMVTSWYSYDELGRVTWMVQNITGVGAKTLDYTYGLSGNVLEVAYQQGQPDAFHHYYEYDQAQRLYKVYTSPDGTARTLQAKYVYYLHGPLKRVELANGLQGVDYTYTLQGWLKGINHVNNRLDPGADSPTSNGVAKDLFGLTLDYFNGDYQSRTQAELNLAGTSTPASPFRYDGTIRTASWRAGAAPAHQSVYDYDAKSQLSQSNFGALTIAGPSTASTYQVTPSLAYKEGGLSYDANGNMQSLRRTDKTGAVTDNFSYEYAAGSNRLSAVHGGGSPSGATIMDYDYDAVGQMTRQRDEAGQRYYGYDVTGKTTGVYLDAARTQAIVEFAYDDRGFRVSKKSYGTGSSAGQTSLTYYVRDAGGNLLSLYEQGPQTDGRMQRSEVPLYGASRLGVLTHLDDGTVTGTDDARYELNDHLGDARVVFHRPTTEVTTASCELTPAASQEDGQWPGLALARRISSVAHQGVTTPSNYVAYARPGGGTTAVVSRTVPVLKGDTLTFSAWTYLRPIGIIAGGGGAADRLHVVPVPVPGTIPTNGHTPDGLPAASRPGLLSRLSASIALVGWGSKPPAVPNQNLMSQSNTRVWLRYRVYDEAGNLVSEQYQYQNDATQQSWQSLQAAVRVAQAGTVEVAIGSDDNVVDAYFDDLRLEQTGGLIVQEQHQYAYGSPLVGLNYAVGNKRYRYGYQGQYAEKDAETGFESFELRLYNDRIGRWTSNDPKGQFSSPYVGMGNNPISGVDPDGGWTPAGIGTLIGAAVGGTIGGIKGYEQGGTAGMWGGIVAGATLGGIAGGLAGYGIGKLGNVDWNIAIQSGSGTARGLNFLYDKVDKSHVFDGTDITIHNVGVHLAINNNPGKTHWIQTAITNVPIDGHASNERYVDNGGNKKNPEYWNRKYFEDTPNRTLGYNTNAPGTEAGFYFSAETSLVRKRADGSYKILKTIRYGFSYDRVTKEVITENLRFHRASQAHKNLIRNFGK